MKSRRLFRKGFHIRKISVRLSLMFLEISFVMFCCFFAITSSLFSDKLTEEMNMVASQQLNFAGSMLDATLEEVRNLEFSLVKIPMMQTVLKEIERGEAGNDKEYKEKQKLLKQEIDNLSRQSSLNVRSMFAIDKDGNILDPLYSGKSYEWLTKDNLEFQRFLDSQLTMKFSKRNSFPFQWEEGSIYNDNTLTCFGRIYDIEDYHDLGYVAININQNSFFTEISSLFKGTFAKAYIVDEFGNIIFSNDEGNLHPVDLLGRVYDEGDNQVRIDGRQYMAYSCIVPSYPKWKIVGFIDCQEIYQPIRNIYATLFAVLIGFILLIGIGNYYMAKHITVPIRTINAAMQEIGEGNWPEPLAASSQDEMAELVEGFNRMNVALQNMTAKIAEQQERARRDEVALVQSQLDLLESQINPHFIHNTLNTMKYMAKIAHADQLVDLINSFNVLLRTSMAQDNMMISVIEEADNLYHYMDIQRARYDMDIDFKCEIASDAEMVPLPKLILQPLVENSLFHGIAPKGGGSIRVRAEIAENRLWVLVWDDGAGIPEDKLRSIWDGSPKNGRGYSKVGIVNVNERLLLNYGASSHLVIDSIKDKGTSCSFSIPV